MGNMFFFYSKNDLLNVNLPSVISGMSESKNSWQLQKGARSSGGQQVPGSSLVVFFTQWRIQVLNVNISNLHIFGLFKCWQ